MQQFAKNYEKRSSRGPPVAYPFDKDLRGMHTALDIVYSDSETFDKGRGGYRGLMQPLHSNNTPELGFLGPGMT